MPKSFDNSLTGGRDRLLEAAQYQETLNRDIATQVGTVLNIHGAMMEQQRNELAQKNLDLGLRNEFNQLRQENEKKSASLKISEFVGSYDPLDSGSRANLDKYKALAVGMGVTAPEINQMFATADMKNQALEQVITSWRSESGVDWSKDENGRIDLDATRVDHEQRLRLQAEQKATWAPNDHRAYDIIMMKSGQRPVDAVEVVTESARARNLYKELIENQLFNPPNQEEFNKNVVHKLMPPTTTGPTGPGADPILSPFVFNSDAFYMNPQIIQASKNLNRIKLGETPEFEKDSSGNVMYDKTTGLAIIKSWGLNPERRLKEAEASAKEQDAILKGQEATVSPKYQERMRLRNQGAASALEKFGIGTQEKKDD